MEMFVVSSTRVIGSNDLSVQIENDKIICAYKMKCIEIPIEKASATEIFIDKKKIRRWTPPHSNYVICDMCRGKILQGLEKALRLLNIRCFIY